MSPSGSIASHHPLRSCCRKRRKNNKKQSHSESCATVREETATASRRGSRVKHSVLGARRKWQPESSNTQPQEGLRSRAQTARLLPEKLAGQYGRKVLKSPLKCSHIFKLEISRKNNINETWIWTNYPKNHSLHTKKLSVKISHKDLN